ncbi:hypothetical protein Q9R46_03865 [Paenibacillus sp. RRE4]|uniref:hypothetical protein n=1 Tax=Paenibacillus sp. RRE4 TaxID=2962587 RepID=UPI002882C790|nr:hypothetical protein [Paenibacillus sp. RRE4]MDT0121763.1 hypothetical protein [Paenibacillus sp. RRE4]
MVNSDGSLIYDFAADEIHICETLHEIALRAVNPDRSQRYPSVAELGLAWKEANAQ